LFSADSDGSLLSMLYVARWNYDLYWLSIVNTIWSALCRESLLYGNL
jgi:hypothetical protein